MNVNLDANINNILFLQYINEKENENGKSKSHLESGQSTHKLTSGNQFEISRKYCPPLSKRD